MCNGHVLSHGTDDFLYSPISTLPLSLVVNSTSRKGTALLFSELSYVNLMDAVWLQRCKNSSKAWEPDDDCIINVSCVWRIINSGMWMSIRLCLEVCSSAAALHKSKEECFLYNTVQRGNEKTHWLLRQSDYHQPISDKFATTPWPPRRPQYWQEDAVVLEVPFRSEEIQRKVKQLFAQVKFPIKLVFEHTPNLKDCLVWSAHKQKQCTVMLEREKRKEQKQCGWPLSACTTCQSELQETQRDSTGFVYATTFAVCSDEDISETSRKAHESFKDHHFQARNRTEGCLWGQYMAIKHKLLSLNTNSKIFRHSCIWITRRKAQAPGSSKGPRLSGPFAR